MRLPASLAACLALCALACGGPLPARGPEPSIASAAPVRSTDEELAAARSRLFGALAASDRRVATRVGRKPEGVSLLFAENRAPAETARLFAWDERATTLRTEESALRGRFPGDPRWNALRRLVREESARLEVERDLPRGASALVRTLALELPVRSSAPADVHAEDEALSVALDRVRDGLRPSALGPLGAHELDDALDLFEKRAAGLAATAAALARLRVHLASVTPARDEEVIPWSTTAGRVAAFAGPLPDDLAARLDAAAGSLAPRLGSALGAAKDARERVAERAASLLLAGADCVDVPLGDVAAPIERRGLCALLGTVDGTDAAVSVATLALALDVARWSLRVHQAREPAAKVWDSLHPSIPLDESDAAHAFRFALVHPIEALTLGWSAALLVPDPAGNAAAWRRSGPVPPGDVGGVLPAPLM